MAQSTKFLMTRDIAGNNGFGVPFATDARSAILTVSVADTFTVPANFAQWIAIFSYTPGASIWVANNTTAAVPTGAFGNTVSELNPAARYVKAGDVLSFITADTNSPMVSVSLYVAPPF